MTPLNPCLLRNVCDWHAKRAKQQYSMPNQSFMFKSFHDGVGKDMYCTNAFLLVQHTTVELHNYTNTVYHSIIVRTVQAYKYKSITAYLCNSVEVSYNGDTPQSSIIIIIIGILWIKPSHFGVSPISGNIPNSAATPGRQGPWLWPKQLRGCPAPAISK